MVRFEGLQRSLVTGGLAPLTGHADRVYRATYARMRARAEELRALMKGEAGRRIRASIRPEALETIERHRAAGHRTVLVTGALDVLVEPLQDLFDEVIATHMAQPKPVGKEPIDPLVFFDAVAKALE